MLTTPPSASAGKSSAGWCGVQPTGGSGVVDTLKPVAQESPARTVLQGGHDGPDYLCKPDDRYPVSLSLDVNRFII